MEGDAKVENAKRRAADHQRSLEKQGQVEIDVPKAGKRTLQEIEDAIEETMDSDKLQALYKEYMLDDDQGQREGQDILMEVGTPAASSGIKRASDMPIEELEGNIGQIVAQLDFEQNDALEIKRIVEQSGGRWAWDDVNEMELPLDKVEEARKEDMDHMKGRIFKVVKKKEAYEKTGKAPISTK